MNKILPTVIAIIIAVVVISWVTGVFVITPDVGPLSESISPSPAVELSAIVKSMAHSSLGNYLTDGMGNTLYVYGKDKSLKSSCEGECAQKWMPYYISNSEGFDSSDDDLLKRINVLQRADDSYQYAYGEKPLYYYYQDKQPGNINGNDVNEFWSIVPVE
jgi:predicted lipoprotein with Yx(FWY)xxD motif